MSVEARRRAVAENCKSLVKESYQKARAAETLHEWQENRAVGLYQDMLERSMKEDRGISWPLGVPRFSLGGSAANNEQHATRRHGPSRRNIISLPAPSLPINVDERAESEGSDGNDWPCLHWTRISQIWALTECDSRLRVFILHWMVNDWPRDYITEILDGGSLPNEFIREALPITLSLTRPMSNDQSKEELRDMLL